MSVKTSGTAMSRPGAASTRSVGWAKPSSSSPEKAPRLKDSATDDGASRRVMVLCAPPPSDRMTVSSDSAVLSSTASIRSGPVILCPPSKRAPLRVIEGSVPSKPLQVPPAGLDAMQTSR